MMLIDDDDDSVATDHTWSIADTDSLLCAREDRAILYSLWSTAVQ